MIVYVTMSTIRHDGFSVFFVMSLAPKLTLVLLFSAVIFVLLFSGSSRRKGERLDHYEVRKRREAAAAKATLAATVAGYVALTAWCCLRSEFVSLADYFSMRSPKA